MEHGMDAEVSLRYCEKIKEYCGGIDPYKLETYKNPLLATCIILIFATTALIRIAYTYQSFKAYKSLEAFKLYESGWVQSILCKTISTASIIIARVKHSYRVNLTPLKCWISVDKDGVILTGHCNCMGGLGEVCSHIGAVLFLLEAWGRKAKDIDNAVITKYMFV